MKDIQVQFDERLELLTVLFYMTDYKEKLQFFVNLQEEDEYSLYKKILTTFENTDLSAMTKPFQQLLETENFGFDAPIHLFLDIFPDFTSYYLEEELFEIRLRKNPLVVELMEAVLAFGKSDEWKQFYNSNQKFYQNVLDGLENLDVSKTFQMMRRLYDNPMWEGKEYSVLLMSGTTAGNYGMHVENTVYCVSGLENGTWYLDGDPTIVIHEFSHSMINPMTDRYLKKEYAEDRTLFADIADKMERIGYSDDTVIVINEYMVRSVECCYYKYYLPEEFEQKVQWEIESGFKDIVFLVEKYLKFLEERQCDFQKFYIQTLVEFVLYLKK